MTIKFTMITAIHGDNKIQDNDKGHDDNKIHDNDRMHDDNEIHDDYQN